MKVRIIPGAARDLKEIDDYTRGTWGAAQANAYAEALDQRLRILAADPELGTSLAPRRPGVFRFRSGRHFIIYKVSGPTIAVLRVMHVQSDYLSRLG